jgi:formate dehydrogenase iron-sulfur subunit
VKLLLKFWFKQTEEVMANQSRRDFFKTAGLLGAGAAGLKPKNAHAVPKNVLSDDRMGVLVDTTVCIGCRRCEYACKKAHDLPAGNMESYDDRSVFENMRRPDDKALTVVNEYPSATNPEIPTNVKIQCMHCDHPACVSACIVGAFSKDASGSVVWDGSKCIGCRYCMVACPFQIPAFEYGKAIQPEIRKCDFCINRTKKGLPPACVEICPVEAITYGRRYELVKLAHQKIDKNPDRYINYVYGEKEVGGTSWMYLAGQDFSKLDFPAVGEHPAPGATESLQHAIFAYFVPPALLFSLLGGIMWINRKTEDEE